MTETLHTSLTVNHEGLTHLAVADTQGNSVIHTPESTTLHCPDAQYDLAAAATAFAPIAQQYAQATALGAAAGLGAAVGTQLSRYTPQDIESFATNPITEDLIRNLGTSGDRLRDQVGAAGAMLRSNVDEVRLNAEIDLASGVASPLTQLCAQAEPVLGAFRQ